MLFLSEQWAGAAEAALQSDPDFAEIAARSRLRMWVCVVRAPEWAVDGTLEVDHGSISLTVGRHGRPHAIGRASYSTWLAMLRHDLHPSVAVATGRLRGRGIGRVLVNRELLDTMLDVFRAIPVDA
ncbi:MAG: hypothetical protein U0U69_04875 [Acidimicrobiia bacterium]